MTRTLARVQPQVGTRRGTIYTYVRSPLYCTVALYCSRSERASEGGNSSALRLSVGLPGHVAGGIGPGEWREPWSDIFVVVDGTTKRAHSHFPTMMARFRFKDPSAGIPRCRW